MHPISPIFLLITESHFSHFNSIKIILIIKFHSLICSEQQLPPPCRISPPKTTECQTNNVKGIWHFLIPVGNPSHFPSITFNAGVTVFILYMTLCYNVSPSLIAQAQQNASRYDFNFHSLGFHITCIYWNTGASGARSLPLSHPRMLCHPAPSSWLRHPTPWFNNPFWILNATQRTHFPNGSLIPRECDRCQSAEDQTAFKIIK